MKFTKLLLVPFFALIFISTGFAASTNQGITLNIQMNNIGIKIVNPLHAGTVCWGPKTLSVGYKKTFTAQDLASKTFQPCKAPNGQFGVSAKGAIFGDWHGPDAITPGETCTLSYFAGFHVKCS